MTTKAKRFSLAAALATGAAIVIAAGPGHDGHSHDGPELADRFASLASLVGYEWQIKDTWSDGSTLEARTQYRVGLAGQFIVSDTYARDNGGDWYHRYHNIYVIDPTTGEHSSLGVTFDGTSASLPFEVKAADDGDTMLEFNSDMPGGVLRQTLELEEERCVWNVWMKPTGADEWMTLMEDGIWERGKKLNH